MKTLEFKFLSFKAFFSAAMFFTSPFVLAQAPSIKVINEVVFHLQKKAFTSYDQKQFESIKAELLVGLDGRQQKILKGLSNFEAFVFFTICQYEAEALDVNLDSKIVQKLNQEKSPWKASYLKAALYLQTKENLFTDQDRFNSWFQMLKNKYEYFKKNSSTN